MEGSHMPPRAEMIIESFKLHSRFNLPFDVIPHATPDITWGKDGLAFSCE